MIVQIMMCLSKQKKEHVTSIQREINVFDRSWTNENSFLV